MIRALLIILEKYGLQVVNLALLGFVSWKLANNHLKHILEGIKSNNKKLEKISKDTDSLKERVSRIEGKLEK